jgi:hypothetical protein
MPLLASAAVHWPPRRVAPWGPCDLHPPAPPRWTQESGHAWLHAAPPGPSCPDGRTLPALAPQWWCKHITCIRALKQSADLAREGIDALALKHVGAGAHVQGRCRQPYGVNPDHLNRAADQLANSTVADIGQVTLIVSAPLRTSTLISCACASGNASGIASAMNAGISC